MTDILQAIKPKTDQLNYDTLIGGQTITIKITEVRITAGEQPVSFSYEGDGGKPYKPCKSMSRVIVNVWGPDAKQYVGRSLTLFGDPNVVYGGVKVGGIRISHMSHIDKETTVILTASKTVRKPYTVKPLSVEQADSDPSVIAAGDEASAKGVTAYSAWLEKLTPEIKQTVRHKHNEWTKRAKEVG